MEFAEWLKAKGWVIGDLSEGQIETLQATFNTEMKAASDKDKKTDEQKPPQKIEASPDKQTPEEIRVAEKTRQEVIRAACDGKHPKIEAQAIKEDWDEAHTNVAILKAMREGMPNIPPRSEDATPESEAQVLTAALCLRANLPEADLVKEYGEKVMEAAYKDRSISLQEILTAALRANGIHVPRSFGSSTVQAAFSTSTVPGILGNVANKSLLRSFALQNIVATTVCSQGDLSDFKEASRFRLNDIGGFDEIAPTGELKHGTVSEDSATNQLRTYGKLFMMTRRQVMDDDLGAFLRQPQAIGARAAQKIDLLFFERLLSNPTFTDGIPLFDETGHKNFADGAATALDVDALDVANRLFLNAVDADGQAINVAPAFLLHPTSLVFTANQLLTSATLSQGGTVDTNLGTANPVLGLGLRPVSSPHLENSGFTGSSTKAWYLFADPAANDTFEIGYLRGIRTPTLEQVAPAPDMLGIGWRAFFDLGIREQEFRTMVKMKGEA